MVAIRILSLLLVLGVASTADALDRAYEQVTGGDGLPSGGPNNNSIDVTAAACDPARGCFDRSGLPCNLSPNARCDFARVPEGRCTGGTGSCTWPQGGGVCINDSDVACLADPPNDTQTDDNGGVGYSSVMCSGLATDGCDMTGNVNACACQGLDPSAPDWEGIICSGVSPSSQARCSDNDPLSDVGGFSLGLCVIIEVGLAETNCGSESVQNLARDGPRYAAGTAPENPPNLETVQRTPGLTPPTPTDLIVNPATTLAIDIDEHNTGPYASTQTRLTQAAGDSYHADWTFTAAADTGGLDANIVGFYCDPPEFWQVNLPVQGVCEPLGGQFCIKDADCSGSDTCTPELYCHEKPLDGFGVMWERNLTAAEQAAATTCPPLCGTTPDFHTGEFEGIVGVQAFSLSAGAQLALDNYEGPNAGEGNYNVVQPLTSHSWVNAGDNRCFMGGHPAVIGDTDGDGLSDVDTCDLLSFVCGDGLTPCSGPGECPSKRGRCDDGTGRACDLAVGGASECGAGIACRPCGGTLGNQGCTGAGAPLACCTGVDTGQCDLTGPGGWCVDCVNTDAARGNPFALPVGYNDHAPLPGLSLFGRLHGLGDKDSTTRVPLLFATSNVAQRSQFRDDTCQPEGQADTCKLGEDSGGLVAGIGAGGSFGSSFVPPIDPLGGPIGVAVNWLAEGTGATCTGCLVVRDFGVGPDGIPGCMGDNEPANGVLVPCDLVLGIGPAGSTGTDDPELLANFGTAAAPDMRSAVLANFLIRDPTRKNPVLNASSATATRDLQVFVPNNTDVMFKTNTTSCPIVGNCAITTALECQIEADCPGSETCENQETSCERLPYCGTLCGLNSTDPVDDTDGDHAFICNADDPCPAFANTLPINGGTDCQTTAQDGDPVDPNADCNGDGIPNECQCGDINLDGIISLTDAIFAFNCQEPPNLPASICDPPQALGIGDANNDGLYSLADALFIFNSQSGGPFAANFMTCPNRPPPGGGAGNPGPPLFVPPGC